MWAKYENIFWQKTARQCKNDARHMTAIILLNTFKIFQIQRVSFNSGKSEERLSSLYCKSIQNWLYRNTEIFSLCLYGGTKYMTPPPKSLVPQTQCHLWGKLGQSAVKPRRANNPPKLIVSHILSQGISIKRSHSHIYPLYISRWAVSPEYVSHNRCAAVYPHASAPHSH